MPFTIFVPITAGWTEVVWYERFLPNTSAHELTSVILGIWLIYHVLHWCGRLLGEPIILAQSFVFLNVHLEAPLLMHYSAAFIGRLLLCGAALSPPGNESQGSSLIGEWFALGNTQHKKASNHHANLPLEMYSFTL